MGKSRKSKHSGGQRPRHQPTGLPSVEETLKAETDGASPLALAGGGSIPASIHTCVDQLQSHEALEKECGLLTLAELCGQPEAGPIFRQLRLTRHVAPLVLDPEESVRVAAVGTLLAMAQGGNDETVEGMVHDDVMTPTVALLRKYFPCGWTPGTSSKELDVYVNAVCLLRSLCESSPAALHAFNRDDAIASIINVTDVKTYNQALVLAVCQCLLTVTESNPPAIESLKRNDDAYHALQHLVQLRPTSEAGHENADAKTLLISVLAAGVLLNLNGDDLSSVPSPILSSVMTLIPAILNLDAEVLVAELFKLRPKANKVKARAEIDGNGEEAMEEGINGDNDGDGRENNDDEGEEEEEEEGDVGGGDDDDDEKNGETVGVLSKHHRSKTFERIGDLLTAQQIALEVLTNICSSADDEWEDDDGESSTSSDGQLEAAGSREDISVEEDSNNLTLPSEIRDALVSTATITAITRCCSSSFSESRVGLEDCLDLAQARLLSRKLCLVQTRALTALHNLVASNTASLGDVEGLVNLFTDLFATMAVVITTDPENLELLEATTSAIRAVVTKISLADKSTALCLFSPTPGDVETLVVIYKAVKGKDVEERNVKINAVRIASILAGSSHVKREGAVTLKIVGSFLLSASIDADVAVAAEALDAVFDVFGADDDDDDSAEAMRQVECQIRLVDRLKDLIPGFQEKVRAQRKLLGPEHRAVVQTVKSNLLRFIKYKSRS